MKRTAFLFMAVCIVLAVNAQTKTNVYLKKVPVLPKDSCNISTAAADNFENQVQLVITELEKEIRLINRQAEQKMKANEATIAETNAKKIQQQYNISDEDMAKMKNAKNLTAAEKQELANKMMMQQTNISMEEAKNMQNMSESGKKAWAEAYAAEAKANAESGGGKQQNTAAAGQYELMMKQQQAMTKITAYNQKIANLYIPVENDRSGEEMLEKIRTWHTKRSSMMGVDYGQGKQMDSLTTLISKEQKKYCEKYTPRYRQALRSHFAAFKASVPDFIEAGTIMSEIQKSQTGIDDLPETKELMSLEALMSYLEKLKDAYKYNIFSGQ